MQLYESLGYKDWGHGTYSDRWVETREDGTEEQHSDPCYYLIKSL